MSEFKYWTRSTAEVIDYVESFLLKQGEPSYCPMLGCRYRSSKGLKCAAGCLIPDDLYDSSMEGETWSPEDFHLSLEHDLLILRMQAIHDDFARDNLYWSKDSFIDHIKNEFEQLRESYGIH